MHFSFSFRKCAIYETCCKRHKIQGIYNGNIKQVYRNNWINKVPLNPFPHLAGMHLKLCEGTMHALPCFEQGHCRIYWLKQLRWFVVEVVSRCWLSSAFQSTIHDSQGRVSSSKLSYRVYRFYLGGGYSNDFIMAAVVQTIHSNSRTLLRTGRIEVYL